MPTVSKRLFYRFLSRHVTQCHGDTTVATIQASRSNNRTGGFSCMPHTDKKNPILTLPMSLSLVVAALSGDERIIKKAIILICPMILSMLYANRPIRNTKLLQSKLFEGSLFKSMLLSPRGFRVRLVGCLTSQYEIGGLAK